MAHFLAGTRETPELCGSWHCPPAAISYFWEKAGPEWRCKTFCQGNFSRMLWL